MERTGKVAHNVRCIPQLGKTTCKQRGAGRGLGGELRWVCLCSAERERLPVQHLPPSPSGYRVQPEHCGKLRARRTNLNTKRLCSWIISLLWKQCNCDYIFTVLWFLLLWFPTVGLWRCRQTRVSLDTHAPYFFIFIYLIFNLTRKFHLRFRFRFARETWPRQQQTKHHNQIKTTYTIKARM